MKDVAVAGTLECIHRWSEFSGSENPLKEKVFHQMKNDRNPEELNFCFLLNKAAQRIQMCTEYFELYKM